MDIDVIQMITINISHELAWHIRAAFFFSLSLFVFVVAVAVDVVLYSV